MRNVELGYTLTSCRKSSQTSAKDTEEGEQASLQESMGCIVEGYSSVDSGVSEMPMPRSATQSGQISRNSTA